MSDIGVKALRWKGPDSSGEYHSLDGLWGYIIRAGNGNGFWLTEVGGYFPTVEAAKVAAFEHYAARVTSALAERPYGYCTDCESETSIHEGRCSCGSGRVVDVLKSGMHAWITAAVEQRAEIDRLRKALEWYANPEIYRPHPHGPAFDRRDLSGHARAVLAVEGQQP